MQSDELTTIATPDATVAFVMNTGFDAALARIRRALQGVGLSIAAEIDSARRVKRALQVRIAPCRVLLVDNPLFMLQAATIHRASAVLIPLHVVVSAAGGSTVVHLLNLAYIQSNELPVGLRSPLVELRRELFRVLSGVADAVRVGRNGGDDAEIPAGWTAAK